MIIHPFKEQDSRSNLFRLLENPPEYNSKIIYLFYFIFFFFMKSNKEIYLTLTSSTEHLCSHTFLNHQNDREYIFNVPSSFQELSRKIFKIA